MLKARAITGAPELLPRELRQYTNRKIFFALGAIIVVALVATITSLIALSALTVVRATGQANNAAVSDLQGLLLDLRTAESNERSYLLTGDPSSLSHNRTAEGLVQSDLAKLKRSIPPNSSPDYRAGLDHLATLTADKLNLMNLTIASYRAGNTTPGSLDANLAAGQTTMSQISNATNRLIADQTAQLAASRTSITHLDSIARDISMATVLLTLILAGIVNYLYARAIQAERALDRAKDEFVSLASHQLRTPVTGIKAILSSLAAGDFGPLEPRQSYFVDKALSSSERELDIIEELLDVAKADAGRLVLHPASLDLTKLIAEVVAEQRRAIEDKHITLKLEQPATPIMVHADQDKLYMAIGNLLDNARKYTPESGIITVKSHTKRKTAVVEVVDTGIGIDPADLNHIFDRFGRAANATGSHIEGTGLGLYLAHHVAELHHGTIQVASKKGHGARFAMDLPLEGG
jgi:signal transduction histidine kinase